MLPWLLFGDDYGDATLAALKSEEKRWLLFVLVVFLSYPILTPILNA
jgi:nitrate reductase NapE component